MKTKLDAFLRRLPRWFPLPAVVCMVLLGGVLSEGITWVVWVAVISSLFLMAWGHGMNSFLDYAWTGFDKGEIGERSKEKTYTAGQSLIPSRILSVKETFWYSFIWLVLSGILAGIVCWRVGPWVWLPWVLGALVTFGYSWGKLHYCCEFILGLGFGPLAVMFGSAATSKPDMVTALIAGVPFFILWGYLAETIDQWDDADVNWPKGLRNMGALLWKNNVSVIGFLAFLLAVTYASQLFIVSAGILSPMTGLALASFLPLSYCLLYLDKNFKVGVVWGLIGVFLYALLLLVGQIVGG